MLKRFESNIAKNKLFTKQDRLLLAFSGGVDSVVLAVLLKQGGYKFDLAHCNFKLRKKESDADEQFSKSLAEQLNLNFYSRQFRTSAFAEKNKLSIQMAARRLRYEWFDQLLKEKKYDFILTAHHLNDSIETVLVNLIRGTGINGLRGVPQKQKKIVRPLLFASKEEIISFAKKNNLGYRSDSSNDEVKYKRNFLRLKIIPELKKLNPSLESTFENNIKLFKQSADVIKNFTALKEKEIVKNNNGLIEINRQKLLAENAKDLLLFEWLHPFGFNPDQITQLMESLVKGSSGKTFFSSTHKALIDRKAVLVELVKTHEEKVSCVITKPEDFKTLPFQIGYEITEDKTIEKSKDTAQLDLDKLVFPLEIRKWEKGDKFRPLGMKGFKKLSDLFINRKLSVFDKEKVKVLCSKNEIVWVIGLEIDERFKIEKKTRTVLKLKFLN